MKNAKKNGFSKFIAVVLAKLNIILISLFCCLDLAWFGYLLKIIFFDSNDDRTFFAIVLFLFLMAVISIPYFISQMLIWYGTNNLLTYKLRCLPKLCMLISIGIAVLIFISDVLIAIKLDLVIFMMDLSLCIRYVGSFFSLVLYIVGKRLTRRKNTEQGMSETNA